MTKEIVNYEYDTNTGRYSLLRDISYYSPRFKKYKTVKTSFDSDGASGPAPDLSGWSWWVHDSLCLDEKWDDGSPCSVMDASLVLHDILKSECRPVRACTWFVATLGYGYFRKAVINMIKFASLITIGFLVLGCSTSPLKKVDANAWVHDYYNQPRSADLVYIEGTNISVTISGATKFRIATQLPVISVIPRDPSTLDTLGNMIPSLGLTAVALKGLSTKPTIVNTPNPLIVEPTIIGP